jgi:hypothetical protein
VYPAVDRYLRPLGKVHAFFRRLRIAVRGTIIEDIDNFNRVSEMFHILQSPTSRLNDGIEGFGYDKHIYDMHDTTTHRGISDFQTVMFKPLSGLLSQTKYLPLRYTPLEIELELADVEDPIIVPSEARNVNPLLYSLRNTSVKWKLQNFMVKVDMCTLDNALDNTYVSHLLSGKTMNIVYNTFVSSLQTVVSTDTQINVSRSLSKMKSIFVSLDRKNTGETYEYSYKRWNTFWSPHAGSVMSREALHDSSHEIQRFQVQIGSKLFPEYPIKSHAECFYSLRKALGVQANNLHSIDINGNEYRNNKFIVGIDTEKLLGLSFTGTNTRNSLMTVHLKTVSEVSNDFKADRMHITLLSEQILEVGDVGVMVYD